MKKQVKLVGLLLVLVMLMTTLSTGCRIFSRPQAPAPEEQAPIGETPPQGVPPEGTPPEGTPPEGTPPGGAPLGMPAPGGIQPPGGATAGWIDGEYEGVGQGYGGPITVSIVITNARLEHIEITGDNETPGIYEEAFEELPLRIITAQSTDVEIVTGATKSSRGVIEAVDSALEAARQQ